MQVRRPLKDELDFQEECPKLQGSPNAVATACEEVALFPHQVVGTDEFRHK